MRGNSTPVYSVQVGCHQQLGSLVLKHLEHPNQRPIADHTLAAFEALQEQVESSGRPLIFDSFCGTGMSSALLAQRHPEHLVLGIDKSAARLARHESVDAGNYLLARADCDDFWRLAAARGWRLAAHYLLYPNPWPKPGQLKRRVHGAPAFSTLLELGGRLELRSNWQVYVEEFGCALAIAGEQPWIQSVPETAALSLHEAKYRESGHPLWRCRCQLGDNGRPQTAANQAR